jgi:hypothetical protein
MNYEERGLLKVRKIDRNWLICQGFQLDLGCITPIGSQLFQRPHPYWVVRLFKNLLQHPILSIFADSYSVAYQVSKLRWTTWQSGSSLHIRTACRRGSSINYVTGLGEGGGWIKCYRFFTMGRGGVLRCVTGNFGYYKCHLAVKNQHIK